MQIGEPVSTHVMAQLVLSTERRKPNGDHDISDAVAKHLPPDIVAWLRQKDPQHWRLVRRYSRPIHRSELLTAYYLIFGEKSLCAAFQECFGRTLAQIQAEQIEAMFREQLTWDLRSTAYACQTPHDRHRPIKEARRLLTTWLGLHEDTQLIARARTLRTGHGLAPIEDLDTWMSWLDALPGHLESALEGLALDGSDHAIELGRFIQMLQDLRTVDLDLNTRGSLLALLMAARRARASHRRLHRALAKAAGSEEKADDSIK